MHKESKSMFARRIGKSISYVSKMCAAGRFPTDEKGFVLVESAHAAFRARRRVGRPKVEKTRRVVVRVRPGQIHKIKKMADALSRAQIPESRVQKIGTGNRNGEL